jgi:hypothetical protein
VPAFTFAPSPCAAPTTALATSASTWHRRLRHPSVDTLSKLSSNSSVIYSRCTRDFCHACQLGCHTRMPFASSTSRADNIFDLIHCDLWTSLVVSVFFTTNTTCSLLMIASILWGLFLYELNLTPFSPCQIFRLCLHIVWSHHQSCSV